MSQIFASFCFFLGILLIAVPSRGDTGSKPILMWTSQFEPAAMANIRYVTEGFSTLMNEPAVKVVGFSEENFSERWERARRSGRLPDVIEAPRAILATLDRRGLIDRAAVTEAIRRIGEESFKAGLLRAVRGKSGSGFFAAPMHAWVQGIWYRRDWFEAANLPPPDSIDRLLEAARHFHRPGDGRYGIILGTSEDVYAEQGFLHVVRAFGVNIAEAARPTSEKKRRLSDSLAFYRDLARNGAPGPLKASDHKLFLQGKAAMVVYSSFFIDTITHASHEQDRPKVSRGGLGPSDALSRADQVGVVTCLRGTETEPCAHYGELTGLAIVRHEKNGPRATLVNLITFLFGKTPYAAWVHMAPGGMLPMLKLNKLSENFFLDLNRVYTTYGRSRFLTLLDDSLFRSAFETEIGLAARLRSSGVIQKTLRAVIEGDLLTARAAEDLGEALERLRKANNF